MPYHASTETGRLACAAAASEAASPATAGCNRGPPSTADTKHRARPQSAPVGDRMSVNFRNELLQPMTLQAQISRNRGRRASALPPALPEPAVSESSIFVGGVPNTVHVDYEKLRRKFHQGASKTSHQLSSHWPAKASVGGIESNVPRRPQSALVGSVAAAPTGERTQTLHKRRPKSATGGHMASFALAGEVGKDNKEESLKPRCRNRSASASCLRTGVGSGATLVDPKFLKGIPGADSPMKDACYTKKVLAAFAKTNAFC